MLEAIRTAGYAGLLFGVLGVLVVLSGQPFVFPSLGPTAFLLARRPGTGAFGPRPVIGGHAIGAVAGLLAAMVFSPTAAISAPAAMSAMTIELAASGTVGLTLTTVGMLLLDAVHPPACATTLIVSLGVLATPVAVTIIILSVTVLYASHAAIERLPDHATVSY